MDKMSKILVIDDHKGNLTSIRAILEDAIHDCQVIEAQSGKEGIELARLEQPDVILLDVVMPEMDGYEVCKRLKVNDRTKHIHVILISAYQTDSKYKVKGYSAGADAFLIRPIERAELSAQITSMLRISTTEQQLKESLQQAKESDRLKTAFLASMSHEFRTPLNAIIGFSAFLNTETTTEEVARYGKIINDNGYNLLKLVEDLFDITLIESGEIRINNEEVEILSILDYLMQAAEQEQVQEREKHIAIKQHPVNIASDLPLHSDTARIKQILGKLIDNAMKFTSEGSVEIGCKRESWSGKQFVTFYVKDTGVGISEEYHKLIFELFRQVDDTYSRAYRGTGSGLFIAKKLTDLLGGELWIESTEGVGSTFFLSLPLTSQSEYREYEDEGFPESRRKVS